MKFVVLHERFNKLHNFCTKKLWKIKVPIKWHKLWTMKYGKQKKFPWWECIKRFVQNANEKADSSEMLECWVYFFAQTFRLNVRFCTFFCYSKNLDVNFAIEEGNFWDCIERYAALFQYFLVILWPKWLNVFQLFTKNLGQWPLNDRKKKLIN